jgi:GT2 family glycosyltransferase
MYSIIICSIDDARFAAVRANLSQRLQGHAHEVIRISDAKSLAEGFNRGIAQSRGDRLIFCHDDIEILSDDFAERLDGHLNQYDLVGIAGANRVIRSEWVSAGPPHIFGQIAQLYSQGGFYVAIFGVPARSVGGICVMDGLFFAARRAVVEKIKFDSQTFDGFHHYDLDFTFAAHLAGFRLAVATDLLLLHRSPGNKDERWKHYARLFHQKYAQHLHPMSQRTFAIAAVQVQTKEEALEVMKQTLAAVRE